MKKNILSPDNPNLLKVFLENIPCPIVFLDNEGKIKWVSPSFEDYMGFKKKDLINKKFNLLLEGEHLDIAKKAIDYVLKNKKTAAFQIIIKTIDRGILHTRVHLIPYILEGEVKGVISISRNITKRIFMEEALKESEKKYKELLENSPIGIYRTTPNGEILFANNKLIEILGFSSLEDLRKIDLEKNGYHPDNPRGEFKKLIESNREVKNYEVKWLKKDGSTIYIRENAKALKDEKGNILYYEGTVEDITKEKKAEEELFQRTRELQTIFSIIPDLFFKINKDGIILDYMAGEKKDLYLQPTEFLGKNLSVLFKEPLNEIFMKQIRESLEKQKMEIIEYELEKEGEKKYFESRVIPFTNDQVIGIVRNITSKKMWEKALKESEIRFRTISENALAGVYIIQDNKFIYVNPAFCQIFGYEIEEIVVKLSPFDLTLKEDKNFVEEDLKKRLTGEKAKGKLQFKGRRKDGSIIYVETHSSLIEILGKPAVMGIILDITEKKNADEELTKHAFTLKKLLDGTVLAMAKIVEVKDPYTAGHQQRVAELAVKIGEEFGLDKNRLEAIQVASMIHDIGKIHIPAEILTKPGELSPLEREMIQNHPSFGYEILKNIEFPWPIAQIVLQHHEKIDGTGYPLHLKGDQIMFEAKIISVADVVEAMSTHRPYRAGHGLAKALDEIIVHCGTWYDEKIVHLCLNLFKEKDFEFMHKI